MLGLLVGSLAVFAQDTPDGTGSVEAGPWDGGLRVSGTEDFRFRYYHVEEKLPDFEDRDVLDYLEAVERLNLQGGTDHLTLSLQGDAVALFMNRYILDDALFHERPLYVDGVKSPFPDALIDLEKTTLDLHGRPGNVALGDSYASFGRGIALNLVKNTEIDVDTSIFGLKGVGHFGPWDVTLVSGATNPQQMALENPNVAIRPDVYHGVSGARVDRYGLGPVNLGAHGVVYQFSRGYAEGQLPLSAYGNPLDAMVGGGNVAMSGVAGLDLYMEGDVLRYQADDIAVDGGWEAYASASAYPGRTSVLLEAKRQVNTEYLNTFASLNQYEVAAGPTLEYERVITEDSSATVNSNDLMGARFKIDTQLGSRPGEGEPVTLVPSFTQAVFRDGDTGGLHFNRTAETISHSLVGLLYIRHETHVQMDAGYRVDVRDTDKALGDIGADRMMHVDLAVAFPIAGPVSVEISPSAMRYHWGANAQQQEDYADATNTLALKVGSPWALLVYTDYSDNPLVASTGNLGEDLYGAVELQWKPQPATTLKAFYGAYRAGIRCAGGQCRQLPGFNGAKVALTTTF